MRFDNQLMAPVALALLTALVVSFLIQVNFLLWYMRKNI